MEFKEIGEINKKGLRGKKYDTDQPLNIDTIIDIVKSYEDSQTKLFECKCSTFSESGNLVAYSYRNVNDLSDMYNYDNPSINVQSFYVDPKDNHYKFTVSMAANTRGVNCFYSEKNSDYVQWRIELDKMQEEATKSGESKEDSTGSYQK